MNPYILSDVENGNKYLKCAIMNALYAIESENVDKIDFGTNLSLSLIKKCLDESGWLEWKKIDTNGYQIDYWYYMESPSGKKICIEGCLFEGQNTVIRLADDYEIQNVWNDEDN